MTLFARLRRLLHLPAASDAGTDLLLERIIIEVGLRLADAKAEIQLCGVQEFRLTGLKSEEERKSMHALKQARRALVADHPELAHDAAARHLRSRQLADVYAVQLRQLRAGRRRLEALAETMEMKLAVLEHQRQMMHARRQLASARQSLVQGLRSGGYAGHLERVEDALLLDELTTDAYQELLQDELPDDLPGDPIERVLAGLREELQQLPGLTALPESDETGR